MQQVERHRDTNWSPRHWLGHRSGYDRNTTRTPSGTPAQRNGTPTRDIGWDTHPDTAGTQGHQLRQQDTGHQPRQRLGRDTNRDTGTPTGTLELTEILSGTTGHRRPLIQPPSDQRTRVFDPIAGRANWGTRKFGSAMLQRNVLRLLNVYQC